MAASKNKILHHKYHRNMQFLIFYFMFILFFFSYNKYQKLENYD